MDISIRNILFPTDFSDGAKSAQEYAISMADRFEATLHLLHVVAHPMPRPRQATPWINIENELQLRIQLVDQQLDRLLSPEWSENHRVVRKSVMGFLVEEILNYAKSQKIDLIVMGTVGRIGVSHLLLGSVAEKVVRMATCPVLTVHPHNHPNLIGDTPSHQTVSHL